MNEPTTKRMIAILDNYHTSKSATSLAVSLARHKNIKMQEGGDIMKHLTEYDQICNEIWLLGGTFSEEQKAQGVLLSLLSSWRVTITQIANFYYFCCFLLLQQREISKKVHSAYTTLSQSCLPMHAFSTVVPLLFSFFVVPLPLVVAAHLLTSYHFATLYNSQAQVVLLPIVCKQKNF